MWKPIAAPDPVQSQHIFALARKANLNVHVIVRTRSEAEHRYLASHGACIAVMGDRQVALGMARYALAGLDMEPSRLETVLSELGAETTHQARDTATQNPPKLARS